MAHITIKTLLSVGNLKGAYNTAIEEYRNNPQSKYAANNLAWVMDAYCKASARKGNIDDFQKAFLEILKLHILENNYALNKALAWRLRDLIMTAQNNKDCDKQYLGDFAFIIAKKLFPRKPSLHYSVLFNAFLSLRNDWNGFIDFCNWWDFNNFRPEDFEHPKLPNGYTLPVSMAESAYIAYTKYLLKENNDKHILDYLPILQKVHDLHPDTNYIGYYIAKIILIKTGNCNKAMKILLPFARKKQNQFWILDILSQAQINNKEKRKACLIRAVNCKTKEEFLTNIRIKLAEMQYADFDFVGAKRQLSTIVEYHNQINKPLPYEVKKYIEEPWFINTDIKGKAKYTNYKSITEDILNADINGKLKEY
jgi:hypothetical protein